MSIDLEAKDDNFEPEAGFEKSVDKDLSLSFNDLEQKSLRAESFFQDSDRISSEPPMQSIEKSELEESKGLNEAFFQENSECPNASFTVKFFNTFEERTELNLKSKENELCVLIKSPSQTVGKLEDHIQMHCENIPISKSKNCCKRFCIIF